MRLSLLHYLFVLCLLPAVPNTVFAKGKQVVKIAYLTQVQKPSPGMSNIDPVIENKGLFGAELGVEDNNTTGEFTKQQYVLDKFSVPVDGDVLDLYAKKIADKYAFVVTNLSPSMTNTLADTAPGQNQLIFDASTIDDTLRNKDCRANVFHLLPSRAMRADSLAQYMNKKRWTDWFLVVGTAPEDKLYADALRRAAKRFGIRIVQEKDWEHTFDARKSAQADVAVFTQIDDEYDILVVADETGEFGEYLDYRTWMPRPVIGTQGLKATAWHRTHEQWGASQIQNRFMERAKRGMEEEDYGAYLAVRAIGESTTRTHSTDLKPVRDYLIGNDFALQGYKGTPLSFRTWDRQLRQPVLLTAPRVLVAVAPVEGFLHPKTELDTLGYDQPETECKINQGQ